VDLKRPGRLVSSSRRRRWNHRGVADIIRFASSLLHLKRSGNSHSAGRLIHDAPILPPTVRDGVSPIARFRSSRRRRGDGDVSHHLLFLLALLYLCLLSRRTPVHDAGKGIRSPPLAAALVVITCVFFEPASHSGVGSGARFAF